MKKQYKLNTQTLTYEVISAPVRIKTYQILKKILLGLILSCLLNLAFSLFMFTPKMHDLHKKEAELVMKYKLLQDKISSQNQNLLQIKHRDNEIYRNIFSIDSLKINGIYTPYKDAKYAHLKDNKYSPLITDTWLMLDAITRLSYLESMSFDQLQALAKDKEKMATAIPAIWPIDKSAHRGAIGLYGKRFHPILKRYAMHYGTDFGAPTGTAIYATADGVIQRNTTSQYSYGKHVLIDHGFGYKTRYAHMNKILVKVGQEVKRGDLIGEVGSTGRSTGPHLHYEVIYNDKHVDPMNYFRRDMSKEEFERILEAAQTTTYED